MTNKYKISELAKDFGLTSKDIIKIVAEKTGAAKKSGAALDEKEISLVFDTLTKQNEVKSFADYFATGAAVSYTHLDVYKRQGHSGSAV